MELKEMIAKRKSVRKYTDEPVSAEMLETIMQFVKAARPMLPDIKVHAEIVTREQVRFIQPWKTPQLIAFYSEPKEGYLENAGFILQQADLYLQSLGLGSCWLGLGKLRQEDPPEGMEFVILLAFGHTEEQPRSGAGEFKRKSLAEIADREDETLESVRIAPSSVNSQPWYFTHEGEKLHAFCAQKGLLKHAMLGYMNRIDMGIALAHLYVCHPDRFCVTFEEGRELKDHRYTATVQI